MDWSKAKSVMIVALLLTNIFLIYACVQKYYDKSAVADSSSFISALSKHGIEIKTDIPETKDRLPILSLSYTKPGKAKIKEILRKSDFKVAPRASEKVYKRVADKFMEELGFSMTDIFSGEVKANGKVVKVAYLSTYEGYSIYAEPLYVVFKNGKIVGLEGKTAIGFPASKRQVSVISPEKALLIFMSEEGKTSQTTEIKSIELVFWVNNENVDEDELVLDTAFPAWRIIYGDSKVRYIEANRE